jgi:Mlc titration factor MtfA (ptsG expression regulator)
MQFDIDDVASLTPQQWHNVILHEMGHSLGVGTTFYWSTLRNCVGG